VIVRARGKHEGGDGFRRPPPGDHLFVGLFPDRPGAPPHLDESRPRLVYFYSRASGLCRRVDGYLAQVLQRRHNHEAFEVVRVPVEKRPDLVELYDVRDVPTLFVVDDRRIRARLETPRSGTAIRETLAPWLR
jgi:thioredoxin-like negative regulator of GroEL